MTWPSHIAVGACAAKLLGLNYMLCTLGAVFPDLLEMVAPLRMKHRGISHSLLIWGFALLFSIFLKLTFLRDILTGLLIGHLLMDSLTVSGIPVFDDNSRHITLFGGKLRTGSPSEFAVSGLIVFLTVFLIGPVSLNVERINWHALYKQGIIDKKEFFDNRFKFF